ncbi:MAG: hypothetical protein HYW89_02495 [Candidatus Sungiibacteriota bacterium]|uniref:Uncharacterized protein n=1 Tax=Candidatus Sungiibacteriota bacterium TaxID=2750080 RepID=A0A7T5URM5_9BACT|nr:MAG: hypothetical protein HYW89_02495 [Candidatus Sungbacteria bacterium]
MENPESELEKRQRLRQKLQEAATEYKENPDKGWAHIGFLVRKKDTDEFEVWYYEPRQIADVTEAEVVFAEGDTFSVEFVEDVLLLEKTNQH